MVLIGAKVFNLNDAKIRKWNLHYWKPIAKCWQREDNANAVTTRSNFEKTVNCRINKDTEVTFVLLET